MTASLRCFLRGCFSADCQVTCAIQRAHLCVTCIEGQHLKARGHHSLVKVMDFPMWVREAVVAKTEESSNMLNSRPCVISESEIVDLSFGVVSSS